MRLQIRSLLIIALCLASTAGGLGAQTLEAQTLTIVGHAQLSRPADVIVVQATIGSNAETAVATLAKSATTIASITKALAGLGIASNAMTVGSVAYTYRPRPSPSASPNFPNPAQMLNPFNGGLTAQFGHNANRQLSVRATTPEAAARVADMLVANGATGVVMVAELSQRKELESAVLAAAVADARRQGDAAAAAAGLRIDRIKEVRPGAPLDQLLGHLENAFAGDRSNPWSASSEARNVDLFATVTVIYILK